MTGASPYLRGANTERTAAAAARTVAAARAALAARPDPWHRPVLEARVAYPDASLAELAARLRLTKHAYAARLRRALARNVR